MDSQEVMVVELEGPDGDFEKEAPTVPVWKGTWDDDKTEPDGMVANMVDFDDDYLLMEDEHGVGLVLEV